MCRSYPASPPLVLTFIFTSTSTPCTFLYSGLSYSVNVGSWVALFFSIVIAIKSS